MIWEEGRTLERPHLVYIVTGKGDLETKSQQKKILPGDVICLYPGEWHRYRPDAAGWEEYWIGFGGEQVSTYLLKELFEEQATYIKNIGYHEEVIYLMQQALTLAKKHSGGFQKILAGIVWQLVAYIIAPGYRPNPGPAADNLYEETLHYIRQQLRKEIDFPKLAEKAGLSYSHFRKLIREKSGVPPQQLLIQERLALAHRLLVTTQLSIAEIAELSGFNSHFYFSRSFKKVYGKAPSIIRKKN